MRIEPGAHRVRVRADENVLAAALAAGLALPHSCRAGRCASCKAKLLSGDIAYPRDRLPPGIVASEAARGEVLLCQAQPRGDLVIETRRLVAANSVLYEAQVLSVTPLPFGGLHVRVRVAAGYTGARPGHFVDVRNEAGDEARVAVVMVDGNEMSLEVSGDGTLREWLGGGDAVHDIVRVSGPYDAPR